MYKIFPADFTKLTDGIPGAEGPVFSKTGQFFVVAPTKEKNGELAGEILAVDQMTGKKKVLCEPVFHGHGGVPAGCQIDQKNDLWVADMRHGLLKVNLETGTCSQVTTEDSNGDTMQGCNDLAFDFHGNLWITAPAGRIAPHSYERSEKEAFGSVYRFSTDGEMQKFDTGFLFSNGIAVMHDGNDLPAKVIVAETVTKTLWSYDVTSGWPGDREFWAKLPGDHAGGPDGMDFDEDNNLLVANWGAGHLEVFGPEGGAPLERIKCPFEKPSNVHFEQNSNKIYVTEHDNDAVWWFPWKRKGKKQYCDI